jgi:hypothetical protein
MSKALDLAKECGIRDNIHDDAAMDYISNARIETFYRRAQAQALREAAENFCGAIADQLRRMADELENQK